MILNKTLELLQQYGKCIGCGSEKLGNGEGELKINESVFIRKCKCGFFVGVDLGKEEN